MLGLSILGFNTFAWCSQTEDQKPKLNTHQHPSNTSLPAPTKEKKKKSNLFSKARHRKRGKLSAKERGRHNRWMLKQMMPKKVTQSQSRCRKIQSQSQAQRRRRRRRRRRKEGVVGSGAGAKETEVRARVQHTPPADLSTMRQGYLKQAPFLQPMSKIWGWKSHAIPVYTVVLHAPNGLVRHASNATPARLYADSPGKGGAQCHEPLQNTKHSPPPMPRGIKKATSILPNVNM